MATASTRPGPDDRAHRQRKHRRELAQARRSAVLRAERRFRLTVVSLIGVGISLPWIVAGDWFDWGSKSEAEVTLVSHTVDDLTIRGTLRLVDAEGNELAVLGREGADGPIVLGLAASSDGEHGLRLATSPAGAAINLRAPDGEVAAGLIVTGNGPELEMRKGNERKVFDQRAPEPGPGPASRALPAVGAAQGPIASAEVDLEIAEVQAIGAGFMVARLGLEERPAGVRIQGRIINTTAVVHSGLQFRLVVAGEESHFEIQRVSPGNSTGFSAELAGLTVAEIGRARIDYLGSTVSFANHSTTPETGRVKP